MAAAAESDGAAAESAGAAAESAGAAAEAQPITSGVACLVHYRDEAEPSAHLSLRITVRPSWFGRDVRAALLGPFARGQR